MTIKVRERGGRDLSAPEWLAIQDDPGFADLVERSILNTERAKKSKGWRLKAGAYVGRATFGGVEVRVVEKIPGALDTLLGALAPSSFRYARAQARVSLSGEPERAIAGMLILAARAYVSRGAQAVYREERLTGSFVTGRLDVRRTAGLRARGVRHKVAFSRSFLDDDTPLNRVVCGALGMLATPGASETFGIEISAPARVLRASFALSARSSSLMSLDELRAEARHVASAPRRATDDPAHEAAVLASAVLEGAALSGEASGRLIPRTWFVNLEGIFEQFVRTIAAKKLGSLALVGSSQNWPGSGKAPPLFRMQPKLYLSNPDLVVLQGGRAIIGDAKYKDVGASPGASDIYQLVAHAAACGADRAALFYPSDGPWEEMSLGPAATGCQAWSFKLDLSCPDESMTRALTTMGLLPERADACM